MTKNKIQSELHKKYIVLKRKIRIKLYDLSCEKRRFWDVLCLEDTIDEPTFNKVKAQTIKEMRLELKCMHKESKILKMKMVQANQAYQRKRLFDRMNNICDEILDMLDAKKENYSV